MTIEEKARAYDEALKLARDYHEDKNCFEYLKGVLENIFPELKESKDEKIRKALIQHIAKISTEVPVGALHRINGVDIPDILAWLEKQGEQKDINPTLIEKEKMDNAFTKMMLKGKTVDKELGQDDFDNELNALLKKYEHLPKKELVEPLEFYLAVLRDTLDIMKWTEEDEAHLHSITTHLGQWIERHSNTCGADIQCENLAWLESLKQRLQ